MKDLLLFSKINAELSVLNLISAKTLSVKNVKNSVLNVMNILVLLVKNHMYFKITNVKKNVILDSLQKIKFANHAHKIVIHVQVKNV